MSTWPPFTDDRLLAIFDTCTCRNRPVAVSIFKGWKRCSFRFDDGEVGLKAEVAEQPWQIGIELLISDFDTLDRSVVQVGIARERQRNGVSIEHSRAFVAITVNNNVFDVLVEG